MTKPDPGPTARSLDLAVLRGYVRDDEAAIAPCLHSFLASCDKVVLRLREGRCERKAAPVAACGRPRVAEHVGELSRSWAV